MTFVSPIVGGHHQPLSSGHVNSPSQKGYIKIIWEITFFGCLPEKKPKKGRLGFPKVQHKSPLKTLPRPDPGTKEEVGSFFSLPLFFKGYVKLQGVYWVDCCLSTYLQSANHRWTFFPKSTSHWKFLRWKRYHSPKRPRSKPCNSR